jgi:polyphosphate kinase
MISEALLEKARLYVRRHFARHIPKHFHFHDLEHTLSVTRTALGIGQGMQLSPEDMGLLEVAALFHDTGYAHAYAGHEEHSARLAEAFLSKQGVSRRAIATVRSAIMATRLAARPRTRLQEVLRDADSAKAGQADFEEKSMRLRRELEAVRKAPLDSMAWHAENLVYLEAHRFYTIHAQRRYGPQKRLNLQALCKRSARSTANAAPRAYGPERFMDRDLSWLSFNDRVLQEAKDPRVPLLERLKFLAIYSSNLDEFYRVRVASLRSLAKLNKADRTALDVPAEKLIERLNRKALKQQQEFGKLYRDTLLPMLAKKGIRLLDEQKLGPAQVRHVRTFFADKVAPHLNTASIRAGNAPFIEDRKLYFAIRLKQKTGTKPRSVLLNIPSDEVGRFLVLPATRGRTDILFLDDAIRLCLPQYFTGYKVLSCHAIKLSRDAELYLNEEFAGNVKDKVRKSLKKRSTGVPSRFLYDHSMARPVLRALRSLLGLAKQDLVPGGRYHNFSDLMKLPVTGHDELRDAPWPPLAHPALAGSTDPFALLAQGDVLLHFPYHDFMQFVRLLQQAVTDPLVQRISITLYRVAKDSAVCAALLDALREGKAVTVFVEVQARFDEGTNLYWGELLEKAGATVLYSYEKLKVHCKLCLIERRVKGRTQRIAYLGTGNFNERTARLYADVALLTARPAITQEVAEVFAHLADRRHRPRLQHLLMAPTTLRSGVEALVDKEIAMALSGRPAGILLKVNSLEDRALISKLYDASRAGVQVRIIVRGICCLVPGIVGTSELISAISIVDRYLEHTRAFVFQNGGDPLVYLSSADWMGRNLDRRIEVAFPVQDAALKQELLEVLDLQWRDRTKARRIDLHQTNPHLPSPAGETPVHAQADTWTYLKKKGGAARRPTKA